MKKDAYSFIRFSSNPQEEGDSVRRQREQFEKAIEKNGWVAKEMPVAKGISAFKGKQRLTGPLSEFLSQIQTGRVKAGSVLVVENIDRASREELSACIPFYLTLLGAGIEIYDVGKSKHYTQKNINDLGMLLSLIVDASRAHEESARKSEFGYANWSTRRNNVANEKLTKRCPAWLKLNDDRTAFIPLPEAVKAVKYLFKLAKSGMGHVSITHKLNREKIKPIGTKPFWNRAYVKVVLKNRAVLGEFTPHRFENGRGSKRIPCETIPNYFPRIISDAEFHSVRAMVAKRSYMQRGQIGQKVSNLFTGLLWSAHDETKLGLVKKKKHQAHRLESDASRRGGKKFPTFNYPAFEQGILSHISEITARELEGRQEENHQEQLETINGQIDNCERRLTKLKASIRLLENTEEIAALISEMSGEKKEYEAERERLLQLIHGDKPDLEEAKSLIALLQETKGEKLVELRMLLRSKLQSLISSIWVAVEGTGHTRTAHVLLDYHGQQFRSIELTCNTGKLVGCKASPKHKHNEWMKLLDDALNDAVKVSA